MKYKTEACWELGIWCKLDCSPDMLTEEQIKSILNDAISNTIGVIEWKQSIRMKQSINKLKIYNK